MVMFHRVRPAAMTSDHLTRFCQSCRYPLEGLHTNACPECGRPFDPGEPGTFDRFPGDKTREIRTQRVLVGAIATMMTLVTLFFIFWGLMLYGVDREKRVFSHHIAQLQGADLVEIGGHYDTFFEVHSFIVDVRGKGRVGIYAYNTDVFTDSPKIRLKEIGPWVIYDLADTIRKDRTLTRAQRGAIWRHEFDIGRGGEFASLLSFEVRNAQDVIDHYDEILALVERWAIPEQQRQKD